MKKLPNNDLLSSLNSLNPKAYDEPSRGMVSHWQTRLPKLMATRDWLLHPITLDIAAEMREKVANVKELLASNPNLTDAQRGALFGEKQALEWFLDHMKQTPESEISLIEASVKAELA